MMEINIDGIETIVYRMESEGFSGEINEAKVQDMAR